MNAKVYNVLFLCTPNSARSIMGECASLDRLALQKHLDEIGLNKQETSDKTQSA